METNPTTLPITVTPDSSESAHKRILCVEDDRDTCEVLRFVMTDFEFTSVHTIEAARKSIDAQPFDLYVLDNWLPDGSGIELCMAIREIDDRVPIIFTSAISQTHDIDRALEAGADRYLVKPYEPETLVQTVKELLDPTGDSGFKS